MKNLLLIIFSITLFPLLSCEKDTETIYKDVIVEHTDTVYFHSRDTVFIVEKSDSIHVGYVYTLTYSSDSVSCALYAASNCKNLPENAKLTWNISEWVVATDKTYVNVGFTTRGNRLLTLNVYLPDKKRNYTTTQAISINIKKP